MSNQNLTFYLSKGNPFNDPCGLSIDQNVFGKSIGGEILTTQKILTGQNITYSLNSDDYVLFDPLVPSDFIKSQINYRAVYILNSGTVGIQLSNITTQMFYNGYGTYFSDVDIAIEGVYTLGEVSRKIPTESHKPTNPSIYLDDEYDSTNKLASLTFKKVLTTSDLPATLQYNNVIKLWVKRSNVMSKLNMPDGKFKETIKITLNESSNSTDFKTSYYKNEGRISLSNWYSCTITNGNNNKIILSDLFPKSFDVTTINIIDIFVKLNKIILYYFTVDNSNNKTYYALIVNPNDISDKNKYVKVKLDLKNTLTNNTDTFVSREIINVKKSSFDPDVYYIFWKEIISMQEIEFLGGNLEKDRISLSILNTNIYSDDLFFTSIYPGYVNVKNIEKELTDTKIIRDYTKLVNVEQFDDLFILFTNDTKNSTLLNVSDLNINKNQLLYVFEKDILSFENNKFNSYPGINAELLSHRLYPNDLITAGRLTSFNVAKNCDNGLIFSNPENVNSIDISAPRKIKYLLDGTEYIDKNSVTFKEFKTTDTYVVSELPSNIKNVNNLLFTTNINIQNDTNIYDSLNSTYDTTYTMSRSISGFSLVTGENTMTYLRYLTDSDISQMTLTQISDLIITPDESDITNITPWFQNNIINPIKSNSQSIPVEWVDRIYKNQWISIASTLTNSSNVKNFEVFYNFHKNQWKLEYNSNNTNYLKIYDVGSGLYSTSDSISGGTLYQNLNVLQLKYALEPGTYQPLSVKISLKELTTTSYYVNFKLYFKANELPIFDQNIIVSDISSLPYCIINPNKTFNFNINYYDIVDYSKIAPKYHIINKHNSLLNTTNCVLTPERIVNTQRYYNNSKYKYVRNLTITGVNNFKNENNKYVTIPIVLYGPGHSDSNTETFDFSKLNINDKNIRFCYENDSNNYINFKIDSYDYENDLMVVWLRLQNYDESKQILLFYGTADTPDMRQEYLRLNANSFDDYLGSWLFTSKYFDERLVMTDGNIFNFGHEPVIYQKTINNKLLLTKIDKEYMYGVSKIYKSHKFNLDLEIPAEESLFFDENTKKQFINFIKQTASILKPSYTQVNNVQQYGFNVIESGELIGGQMGVTTNQKVSGMVTLTPNSNVNTYYEKLDTGNFNLLTSFAGFSNSIDWLVAKAVDTKLFKSGVLKINGKIKNDIITFEKPFKDSNYFVVLSSPSNQKIFWNTLCNNKFSITSSYYFEKEVSWMAFHKDMFGGVYTANSIYVGDRTISGSVVTSGGESPSTSNLSYWYNNELWITPNIASGDPSTMNIDPTTPGYSLVLSSNENINIYWTEKLSNGFRIKTSSPSDCTIHWVIIKNGVEWFKELS